MTAMDKTESTESKLESNKIYSLETYSKEMHTNLVFQGCYLLKQEDH